MTASDAVELECRRANCTETIAVDPDGGTTRCPACGRPHAIEVAESDPDTPVADVDHEAPVAQRVREPIGREPDDVKTHLPARWEEWPEDAQRHYLASSSSRKSLYKSLSELAAFPERDVEGDGGVRLTKQELADVVATLAALRDDVDPIAAIRRH